MTKKPYLQPRKMSEPKVIVLSLKRARDRQTQIEELLRKANIPFEFFWGTEGNASDNPVMQFYDERLRVRTKGEPLSPGQLGCFGSHYRIWQKCVNDQQPLIVLEDDAKFDSGLLNEFIANAHYFPDEAGCIRLFTNNTRNHKEFQIGQVGSFQLLRYTKGPMSTMGYYLTPKGASMFLKSANPVFLSVDIYMDRYWVNNVLCCGVSPSIVSHDYGFESMIGYDKKGKVRGMGERIRRETFTLTERLRRFTFNLRQY